MHVASGVAVGNSVASTLTILDRASGITFVGPLMYSYHASYCCSANFHLTTLGVAELARYIRTAKRPCCSLTAARAYLVLFN